MFIGMYEVDSTEAAVLWTVIHDVLLKMKMNISGNKLRGQCLVHVWSRTRCGYMILQEEPRALYTHCYGHALNLVCRKESLDTAYEIIKLIKK